MMQRPFHPLFHFCKHFTPEYFEDSRIILKPKCEAFSEGIPDIIYGFNYYSYLSEIASGKYIEDDGMPFTFGYDHRYPLMGDQSIQFQRANYKKLRQNRVFTRIPDSAISARFISTIDDLMVGRLWGWTLPTLLKDILNKGLRPMPRPIPKS